MRSPPSVATGLFAGRYAIEREIGQGASAIVYLARDTQAGSAVALKILRPELAESRASDRFLREIKRTSALQHPHILPVLEAGEHEGQLYFALPYMEGGTLRQLLKREKHLELSRVIEISRTVAEALDYAHERGLIHRDVKPENILFTDGVACLGDFGIARAIDLSGSGGTGTTSRTMVRGTPAYMSPEQAAASQDLDGRSDVFSLACVIYEMITGMQAYIGPTDESVIAQRFLHPPREVRVYRPTAPAALDSALKKAFATIPADRYRTATDLVRALAASLEAEVLDPGGAAPDGRHRTRWAGVAALVAPALVVVVIGASSDRVRSTIASVIGPSQTEQPPLDTLRYAVIPMEDAATLTSDVAERMREQLRGHGFTAVEPFYVRDALNRVAADVPAELRARRAAQMLGAGRYLRISAERTRDSVTLAASMFDTRTNALLRSFDKVFDSVVVQSASAIASLLDPMLASRPGRFRTDAPTSTASPSARRAYLTAHGALESWNLAGADSQFRLATEIDPGYVQAFLWLAQVRSWQGQPAPRWRYAAEKAAAGTRSLSPRDSLLARALAALANGRRVEACDRWTLLTRNDPYDFAGWYGLGICLTTDTVVVQQGRDRQWRFRSSYWRGLEAYENAFRLFPLIHRSFRGGSFEEVQRLLMTSPNSLRAGRPEPPDTGRFLAYPSWSADSLAFIPIPAHQFRARQASSTRPASANDAVLHQRKRFHDIATMWRAALPGSADALHAVAASLDLLGDVSALDSLRLARDLTTDPIDRLRLGLFETWLRIKVAVPTDLAALRYAGELADSLLRRPPASPAEARLLSSLAALRGRVTLAARYARLGVLPEVAPAISSAAPALVVFAAAGGPEDSVASLYQSVRGAIDSHLPSPERPQALSQWLLRAAALYVPARLPLTAAEMAGADFQARLVRAWQTRDLETLRGVLGQLDEVRRQGALRAGDRTADALYAEAAMLASLGDEDAALRRLTPTLDSLSQATTQTLIDPVRALGLVRSMALRARLAHGAGDVVTARIWARAANTLWSDADPQLRSSVAGLQSLVK